MAVGRHAASASQRFAALSEVERARWLDSAEREFRAQGFYGASLNRILSYTQASKGQFYYYFADKEALYRAVIKRAMEQFVAIQQSRSLITCASAEEFWSETAAMVSEISQSLGENLRFAELARGIHCESGAELAVTDLLERMRKWLETWAVAGQQLGAVRGDLPLDLLTSIAFAAMREADRWFAIQSLKMSKSELSNVNNAVIQMLIGMLSPPGQTLQFVMTLFARDKEDARCQ